MTTNNFNPDIIVDSVLCVKASGCVHDQATQDLLLDNGKSIAELLDDQEKNTQN